MARFDHRINWKGFFFAAKLFAVFIVVGFSASITAQLIETKSTQKTRAVLTVATTTLPHALRSDSLENLSTTTSQRFISTLTIEEVVPKEGKFIAADLSRMQITLYENGVETALYPIKTKGRPGTPWETPSGYYRIQTKEQSHFSSIGKVYMPYSMQFYGNYFIHGMTYYPDGTPTSATFSGGCIKLEDEYAEKVFAFADLNTPVFVYDPPKTSDLPPLPLSPPAPRVTADSYLVADIDTREVYAERNAKALYPAASATTFMTALVANETISLNKKVTVPEGVLFTPQASSTEEKTFFVNDLFYPLLMQTNTSVADALASYYSKRTFINWMNATARSLGMDSTTFADVEGSSQDTVSTAEDLYRFAYYLAHKKSFVLTFANTERKTITADDGTTYTIAKPSPSPETLEDIKTDTALSVVSLTIRGVERRVAIVVLNSAQKHTDVETLSTWTLSSAGQSSQAACAYCSLKVYRKIEL